MKNSTEETIQAAILAAKSGNKAEAKKILSQVVRKEPRNERAWYLLHKVVDNNEQAKYCLEQVLKIHPDNQQAQERLNQLSTIEDYKSDRNEEQYIKPHQPSKEIRKSKKSKNWFIRIIVIFASIIGLSICLLAILLYTNSFDTEKLFNYANLISSPTQIYNQANKTFIKTIEEFEKSNFCKEYQCNSAAKIKNSRGTNHSYFIDKYPVYNEFLIEVIAYEGVIFEYGLTLDPRTITSADKQFLETLFSSIYTNKVDPEIIEFINENLENHVTQICYGNSIQFHSKNIWVGKVGLAPTIKISEYCEKNSSNITPPKQNNEEVQAYILEIRDTLGNMIDALTDYQNLKKETESNPDIVFNDDWLNNINIAFDNLHNAVAEFREIKYVPEYFRDSHDIEIKMVDEIEKAADDLELMIINLEAGKEHEALNNRYSAIGCLMSVSTYSKGVLLLFEDEIKKWTDEMK